MLNKKIGEQIKSLRKSWGLSQLDLAERIGISFQQVQKYEKGTTKISVMRLYQISKALGADITYFFREKTNNLKLSDPSTGYLPAIDEADTPQPLDKDEVLLLKLFRKISNKRLREAVFKQLRGVIDMEKQD